MATYFRGADYSYIYLSLVVALFGFLSRGYRWKFALAEMGYQPKFHNNFMAVCICYFLNLTIPRSGEISRALILKKYENVPFDKAFGTIVAERVVDFAIFLIFVGIAFILQFSVLRDYMAAIIPIPQLIILAVVGIILAVIFALIWLYAEWPLVKKLKIKLSGLVEGMFSILKMKHKWAYLFHSVFIWFTYLLMFYVTIFALPETQNIGIAAVMMGFIFGTLATGFTNGGFGAYPLLVAEILMLYGVSDVAGTAFGWLVWISQTVLTVVLGGLSFLLLPVFNKSK